MKNPRTFVLVSILLLMVLPGAALAVPTLPAKIGGTVEVDGTLLTSGADAGYRFVVTHQNGSAFSPPAEDNDGLNTSNFYTIDIPIYDAADVPGGALPGEEAVIHVYKDGKELDVLSPSSGRFPVGDQGSITTLNLSVKTPAPPAGADPTPPAGGSDPAPTSPTDVSGINSTTCVFTGGTWVDGACIYDAAGPPSEPTPTPEPTPEPSPEPATPSTAGQAMTVHGPEDPIVIEEIDTAKAASVTLDPSVRFEKPPMGDVAFYAGLVKDGRIFIAEKWVDGSIIFTPIHDAGELVPLETGTLAGGSYEWRCRAFDHLDIDLEVVLEHQVMFFMAVSSKGDLRDLQAAAFSFK